MRTRGVVAAGHVETAAAAEAVLREGGNAFDAIVAAHLTACVAEPVLTSLAGGGFLLGYPAGGAPVLYDFFAQTPRRKRPAADIDFRPIHADFGTVSQEFHIGLGAVATPGCVRGLFAVHADLCTMPMRRLAEPAIELARSGIELNDFQAYIFSIVKPIYLATQSARGIFADPAHPQRMIGVGQRLRQPDLAATLEALAIEGEDLFYRGEIGQRIVEMNAAGGGHIMRDDLEHYAVERRSPLTLRYRNHVVFTNPPPSSGGALIAFALRLMECTELGAFEFGSARHLCLLAEIMRLTNKARIDAQLAGGARLDIEPLLEPELVARYRERVLGRVASLRGTTHVSVIDEQGNVASMTASNGEGCGHIVAGTGIMLNNMLGEEDINPGGFHRWPANSRMTSMMAPSVMLSNDGGRYALGSGGSNRLRSAILQVLSNIVDFGMSVEEAVTASRIHVEAEHLSVEHGLREPVLAELLGEYPDHTVWPELNLFFGGAHTVAWRRGAFSGVGDPRRGGVAILVG